MQCKDFTQILPPRFPPYLPTYLKTNKNKNPPAPKSHIHPPTSTKKAPSIHPSHTQSPQTIPPTIHTKTISSHFLERVSMYILINMKISQLHSLLSIYPLTPASYSTLFNSPINPPKNRIHYFRFTQSMPIQSHQPSNSFIHSFTHSIKFPVTAHLETAPRNKT